MVFGVSYNLLHGNQKKSSAGNMGEIWLVYDGNGTRLYVNQCFVPGKAFVAMLSNRQKLGAFCSIDIHVADNVENEFVSELLSLIRLYGFSNVRISFEKIIPPEIGSFIKWEHER